jgi:hypothetical protein
MTVATTSSLARPVAGVGRSFTCPSSLDPRQVRSVQVSPSASAPLRDRYPLYGAHRSDPTRGRFRPRSAVAHSPWSLHLATSRSSRAQDGRLIGDGTAVEVRGEELPFAVVPQGFEHPPPARRPERFGVSRDVVGALACCARSRIGLSGPFVGAPAALRFEEIERAVPGARPQPPLKCPQARVEPLRLVEVRHQDIDDGRVGDVGIPANRRQAKSAAQVGQRAAAELVQGSGVPTQQVRVQLFRVQAPKRRRCRWFVCLPACLPACLVQIGWRALRAQGTGRRHWWCRRAERRSGSGRRRRGRRQAEQRERFRDSPVLTEGCHSQGLAYAA